MMMGNVEEAFYDGGIEFCKLHWRDFVSDPHEQICIAGYGTRWRVGNVASPVLSYLRISNCN